MKQNHKRRRRKLWEQDSRCRLCGIETVLPETLAARYGDPNRAPKKLRLTMATIEHMRSRYNPDRGKDSQEATTLYCLKCNGTMNDAEQADIPVEVRQARAGCYPFGDPRNVRKPGAKYLASREAQRGAPSTDPEVQLRSDLPFDGDGHPPRTGRADGGEDRQNTNTRPHRLPPLSELGVP